MKILHSMQDLQLRHMQRFASMASRGQSEMVAAGQDLMTEVVRLHSGTFGGSGSGRLTNLRKAGYPFAQSHGFPLWATPPVGVISGTLRNSLRVTMNAYSFGQTTVKAASVGVSWAQFVYAPAGTSKMVARGVIMAANLFSEMRIIKVGRDLMAFQLRLL